MPTPEGDPPGQIRAVFAPDVRFGCRCGGHAAVGHEVSGGKKVPMATHSLPICDHFVALDLPDFMAWVRTGAVPKGRE